MSKLTYHDLVQTLFPRLTGGIRWGLERTESLLERAGQPHRAYRTLHVGGTNGKGSVCATLASVLQQAGYRTGLYTSPHLCSFRERIRIDGVPIGEAELVRAAEPLLADIVAAEASFFEATTVIAFEALRQAEVDIAVVEVGLGGRLDSTNVITPDAAIITNIALDHAEYLGSTLEAIAREKAGIIKRAMPVITGETEPALLQIFREQAARVGATVSPAPAPRIIALDSQRTVIEAETDRWGRLRLESPLVGEHQARNVGVAVHALDRLPALALDAAAVSRGAAAVRWPGRFEVRVHGGRTWVFDVAHNEAGVHAFAQTFGALDLPRPAAMLVGILGDKDWRRMLPPLFGLADHVILTVPPTAPAGRVWRPDEALARVPSPNAAIELDFARAVGRVRDLSEHGTAVVIGSFHTVGDALALLGWCEADLDFPLPHNNFSR